MGAGQIIKLVIFIIVIAAICLSFYWGYVYVKGLSLQSSDFSDPRKLYGKITKESFRGSYGNSNYGDHETQNDNSRDDDYDRDQHGHHNRKYRNREQEKHRGIIPPPSQYEKGRQFPQYSSFYYPTTRQTQGYQRDNMPSPTTFSYPIAGPTFPITGTSFPTTPVYPAGAPVSEMEQMPQLQQEYPATTYPEYRYVPQEQMIVPSRQPGQPAQPRPTQARPSRPSQTAQPTQTTQVTQPTQITQPVQTTGTDDSSIWVNEHNRIRANVGQGPVTWNSQIAQGASQWANNCKFEHSADNQRMLGSTQLGENLAWGSPYDTYDTKAMVGMWEDEKKSYHYPDGPGSGTGHYTQIINKGVKQIGCGCAKCDSGSSKMCVCRYDFAQYGGEPPY